MMYEPANKLEFTDVQREQIAHYNRRVKEICERPLQKPTKLSIWGRFVVFLKARFGIW